jgi:hypothetical protein
MQLSAFVGAICNLNVNPRSVYLSHLNLRSAHERSVLF